MNIHPNSRRFIGCDVGKTTLVFGEHGQYATHEIANCRAGIEAFATRFDADCLMVCEATGGHEALLIDLLAGAGIAVHRADARKVKAFSARMAYSAKPMPSTRASWRFTARNAMKV